MAYINIDDWTEQAACRGPKAGLFFPPSSFERKVERLLRERQAKAICATCPVAKECLDYAIEIKETNGIWGGLNEEERVEIFLSKGIF